jgi:DNA-binding SARP family transcriptional activator/TolB-like protein/Flp pilus assembly protein TadD
VESDVAARAESGTTLEVRLLGPLAIRRAKVPLPLPRSRKVRALIAYLALAERAMTRSHLCDLLWDVSNDPRGELRWCLSKIRGIVDEPGRRRVETRDDTVRLDLSDCVVDAIELTRAMREGIARVPVERLRAQVAMFAGEFGEGLEVDRSPGFNSWLTAQRRRFRAHQAALLEQLATDVPDDETVAPLERWLEIAPFETRAHELLLDALALRGRIREGEEHLAATTRLFESEGLDASGLRDAWRTARARTNSAPRPKATAALPLIGSGRDSSVIPTAVSRRASIAVMPFLDLTSVSGVRGGLADGLAHDIITRLAKLRVLFVIAQGTVFDLHERRVSPEAAGQVLQGDYLVSGSVRQDGERLTVSVQLAETHTARIVWAEVFSQKLDDTFMVLDEIGNRIVASIASEIETIERNRAVLLPPNSLDAWESHHRGLWHMYRLNQADNERARHYFQNAVRLDPTFARAYAGLSFTHWQNVFQGWTTGERDVDLALEAAGHGLMADDRDPAAHWAMGRALWLRGKQEQSLVEFEQAVDLSPNFAVAHYNVAFVNATAGDPATAISSSDHARGLSPFDPMLFGMLGARAMALVRLGRFDEAAGWAVKAATRPNAFAHIQAIAAYSLALAGRVEEARPYLASIRKPLPNYRADDLITAMKFDAQGAALFREGAGRIIQGG